MLLDDKRLSETAGKKQPQTETAEPDTQEISVKGSLAEYLLTLIFKRLLEASQQQLEANQKKTAPTYQATKEPWQPFVLPAEIEEPILPKQSWLSRIIKHLKNSLRLENLRII